MDSKSSDGSQRSIVESLIHIYKCGSITFDELAPQLESALEVDPESESIVRRAPDVWDLLVSRRELCKAEGVDLRRVSAVFVMRHTNNELVSLFKIDSFGKVECTVPHENGFDLVIGNVALSKFGVIYQMMLSVHSKWKGEYTAPKESGDICQIVIGVFTPYGEKPISKWTYGSSSVLPPEEIMSIARECDLVAKSISVGPCF
jgi:hypothetical protein